MSSNAHLMYPPTGAISLTNLSFADITKAALLAFTAYTAFRLIQRKPYDPLPYIGVLHIFLFKTRQEYLQWFLDATTYKGVRSWRYWAPGLGWNWFTTDPAVLKTVLLTKNAHFSKADFFASVTKDLFGKGILLSTGESWKAQRTAGQLFGKAETLVKLASDILPRNFQRAYRDFDHAASSGDIIDFERVMADLTLAVFGELAFDTDAERLMRVLPRPFDLSMALLSGRMAQPLWPLLEPLTAAGREGRRSMKEVNDFARQLVRETLEQLEAEEEGAKDEKGRGQLIREIMQAGLKFSEKELAESCINFLIAGRDTTSNAMTWTLYALLSHPSAMSRVQVEIASLPSDIHNMDIAQQLPFLEACISESLRLYPPVPTELVDCTASEPVLVGISRSRSFGGSPSRKYIKEEPDVIVRPGESVIWCPWVMSRTKEIWGDDAEEWKPERWFKMMKNSSRPNAYENPVFHAGRRSCVGQQMARLELVVVLRELMGRYEFKPAYEGERRYDDGMTGAMEGGLPVRVHKREIYAREQ